MSLHSAFYSLITPSRTPETPRSPGEPAEGPSTEEFPPTR